MSKGIRGGAGGWFGRVSEVGRGCKWLGLRVVAVTDWVGDVSPGGGVVRASTQPIFHRYEYLKERQFNALLNVQHIEVNHESAVS